MDAYRVTDPKIVNRFMSDPTLVMEHFPEGTEPFDFTPLVINPDIYFIGYGNPMEGLYGYVPIAYGVMEMHLSVSPRYRSNPEKVRLGKETIEWIFRNTTCHKICASVPSKYIGTQKFCEKLGFIQEGLQKNQLSINNVLYDVALFGKERT